MAKLGFPPFSQLGVGERLFKKFYWPGPEPPVFTGGRRGHGVVLPYTPS